jgi:signal transduction histidine kinase
LGPMAGRAVQRGASRLTRFDDRWLALFVFTRAVATGVAVLLLLVRPARPDDTTFAIIVLGYGLGSVAIASWIAWARDRWQVWLVDACVTLGLVAAAGEWRSPFYLLAVTALVFPATNLRFGRAVGAGIAFTAAYVAIAFATGISIEVLDSTARLETLATHIVVPLLVSFSLAYAARLLRALEDERERSERLAVETERRRIAWELHDSSKQRVHAAHLVLTNLAPRLGAERRAVEQAIAELNRATMDMDTSLWELRAPLESERLEDRIRGRAAELSAATSAAITVHGDAPPLPGWMSTHIYRIASEALANAVRHADPRSIELDMQSNGRQFEITVTDDGVGIGPSANRTNGFESMTARAEAMQGRLSVQPGPEGRGTVVELQVPLTATREEAP